MSGAAQGGTKTPLPQVVVIYGGRSAEAEISVVSGSAISAALIERGADVVQLLIVRSGLAALLPDGHRRGARLPAEYTSEERATSIVSTPFRPLGEALAELVTRDPSAVFLPAMHGPGDEDGEVQQLLERAGVAFVGARPTAASLGMDKVRFKDLASSLGVPVLPHIVISARDWSSAREATLENIRTFAGETTERGELIGKPVSHGSSIGMRIARTPAEWPLAVDLALQYGDRALLEPYLTKPRELEVALLEREDGSVAAFGPGEVFPGREFYDYDAKYADGVSQTTTAPHLDVAVAAPLRTAALQLFGAFGGRGLARMDFLMESAGPKVGTWYLSEVNTFPGFTPISLFPALVMTSGMSFADLAVHLVLTAVAQVRASR
jgi:D-alanine-D-alanine ligase